MQHKQHKRIYTTGFKYDPKVCTKKIFRYVFLIFFAFNGGKKETKGVGWEFFKRNAQAMFTQGLNYIGLA
jgi:hypothetical protein